MDIDYIRSAFDCDYDSGDIYRVCSGGVRVKAGTTLKSGYKKILVNGRLLYSHRVIWAHFYREQPPKMLDHIDRDPSNNSIANLRPATPRLNQSNRKLAKNNTTGFTGVSIHKRTGKYKATIYVDSKPVHLGLYESAKEASDAYNRKKQELF